ncbi:nuclear transcription factor Y subunit A-3 [Coffea arabica]|uniref:Nuclear transcription factor Y subunit n=1 Tax=Coffea arabica TaxID=13443 RepID=A0A6P6XGK6_COFAR
MPDSITTAATTSSIFTKSQRMQDLLKGDDLNNARMMAPCVDDSQSWWTSTNSQGQQSSLSRNLTFKAASPVECFQGNKQLGFHFQDQESSSTQSTGQSCPEVASMENEKYRKNITSVQPGWCGLHAKPEEDPSKSSVLFQDYIFPCSSIDYRQHATYPFNYTDPYNHGLVAAYGPHSVVHSQMMGMTPIRVPLPLDAAQDEPIFVNAKQFKAIMRRRESRAKQEAQNNLSKNRKPYLHESRHRHALNRARGSGGRFLNTKELQESKAVAKTNDKETSGSLQLQLNMETTEPEVCQTGNKKDGISITACSDITSASNGDDALQRQDFRFSGYRPHVGSFVASGGSGRTGGVQQFLSIR